MQAFRKLLCSVTLLLVSQQIHAQGGCEQWLGKLASSQGQVEIRRAGTSIWRPVMRGERYCDLDAIRTGRNSRAVLLLNTDPSNRTLSNINQNTFLTFKSLGNEPSAFDLLIDLLKGGALFRSRQPNRLDIETPYVNAAHRGTEFFVRVDADQTLVSVYDGQVATSNAEGKLTIDKGETALAKRGKAPVQYALVRPRDAVQWALNYPPVIDYHMASSTPSHPAIGDALSAYRRGDLLEALAILDKVSEGKREPDYYTTKAGLSLSVGRVDEATPAIEQALKLEPKNATAFALKSVIAVAQNQNDKAMQLAERAAQLDPESPTPQVALSYAHQAKFELEKALESAEKAAELGPGNALALSRLSELQLSMGDLDEALEAAEKASTLDPDLARTQTVLGFAYLTKIDIDEARQSFEKAIKLDQAAPLPHLGLGLAKIREGELKNGTDEIEIAASLDPGNSLIRSYLGKAFYEKKENILAGTELEIAKELDPNDPTPWFYDAIRKQTTNRPVEALHDMQKAIELNDNRAVYRSRLLLDDDLAARGAALGRIYNELGFEQRGLIEGWTSVTADPSNYSAHRLLSDTYAGLPRHETARVSELLQSQLLQPINITPVQPQLAESNLFLLGGLGPSEPSLNEFNSLFLRNRFSLLASGLVGSQKTYGDEVVQSGIWDKFSYSLGQFHYESDGFRPNNDLDSNLYTVYAQYALSPHASAQLELRREESESGDNRNFADSNFRFDDFRDKFITNTARIGFRRSFGPGSEMLGSFAYRELNRETDNPSFQPITDSFEFAPPEILSLLPDGLNNVEETANDIDSKTSELQFIKRWKSVNAVVGVGYSEQDRAKLTRTGANLTSPLSPNLQQDIENLGFPSETASQLMGTIDDFTTPRRSLEKSKESHLNGYIYVTKNITTKALSNLYLTLGTSIQSIDRDSDQSNELELNSTFVNPKVGVIWEPYQSTRIRASWFRSVKRPFASGQTIEPTHVAGFNQLFDDSDDTRFRRYGVGLDQKFPWQINGGIEFSWRDLKIPTFLTGEDPETKRINQEETVHRAYLYWTPNKRATLSAEYFYEDFDRDPLELLDNGTPLDAKSHRVPLSFGYFHPSGFFTRLTGIFVDQGVKVVRDNDTENQRSDRFWSTDIFIGYRLPKRLGIVTLGVKNVFDEDIRFQDASPNVRGDIEGELVPPLFVPERAVFGRLTLAF